MPQNMTPLALAAALLLPLPLAYMWTATAAAGRLPVLRNKRICLLIAHPDDEAMFFAPTVLALARPETGNHVKILCLSTGDADGLGETRRRELVKSGLTLGLRAEEDVFVLDSPDFRDSITTPWPTAKIATLLASAFAPQLAQSSSSSPPSPPPRPNIDALITFDAGGVSAHPNHVSLYHGARAFVAALAGPGRAPVDLYTLTSVSFARKYLSVLDLVPTLAVWAAGGGGGGGGGDDDNTGAGAAGAGGVGDGDGDAKGGNKGAADQADHPRSLVFLNSLTGERGLGTAWRAMTAAHKSQMVWFRWGWIAFSRYMVMNDLRLERVTREGGQ